MFCQLLGKNIHKAAVFIKQAQRWVRSVLLYIVIAACGLAVFCRLTVFLSRTVGKAVVIIHLPSYTGIISKLSEKSGVILLRYYSITAQCTNKRLYIIGFSYIECYCFCFSVFRIANAVLFYERKCLRFYILQYNPAKTIFFGIITGKPDLIFGNSKYVVELFVIDNTVRLVCRNLIQLIKTNALYNTV